jgi:ABC-type antimicrobial peptide transport system permease subunit
MVLRQGLRWAGLGLVLGLAGAAAGSRLLEGMLFGVTPLDAGTYAVVVLGAILVVGGACIGPALRATRVGPQISMRA